ncbi:unnamed protein product [Caenorhabditis brenneri]
MLYFPSFYCRGPDHKGEIVWYDAERHKPVSGLCGHTVCLRCQTKHPRMKCPICHETNAFFGQEPNYQVMEMMVTFRNGLLQMLEIWWEGEKFGIGACSNCSSESQSLKLCLDCHSNLFLHDQKSPAIILNVQNFQDLMELSTKVFCSECAFSQHLDKGHRIEKVENFNFDKRKIKTNTAKEILAMFRLETEYRFEIRRQTKRNGKTDWISLEGDLIEGDLKCLEYYISELLNREVDPKDPKKLRESVRHALVELHIKELMKKTKKVVDSFGPREWTDVPEKQCTLCIPSDGTDKTRVRKVLNDYVRDYKNNETVDMTLPHSLCLRCLNLLDRNFK